MSFLLELFYKRDIFLMIQITNVPHREKIFTFYDILFPLKRKLFIEMLQLQLKQNNCLIGTQKIHISKKYTHETNHMAHGTENMHREQTIGLTEKKVYKC